jgi:tetratricopeptide (TPR) repeat protein
MEVAHRRLGDRTAAVESFDRLSERFEQSGDWRAQARVLEAVLRFDDPHPVRHARLGAARRRLRLWGPSAEAYQRAALAEPTEPSHHYWLAVALHNLGDWQGAASALGSAIELDDTAAPYHYQLGLAHEHLGSPELVVDARTGLRRGPSADWAGAERCYRAAAERDPSDHRHWLRLGIARRHLGDLTGAADALSRATELRPDDAGIWFRQARIVEAAAAARGAYRPEEHDQLTDILQRTLELDPGHLPARQRLVRVNIRAQRWKRASEAAWFPPPTSTSDPCSSLRSYLESPSSPPTPPGDLERALARPAEELAAIPSEWWFPLHWRLLTEGRVSLAYRAKAHMAEQLVREAVALDACDPARLREVARALAHLDRVDDAIDHLRRSVGTCDDVDEARAVAKLIADLRLTQGDVGPYAGLLDEHEIDSDAEARFRELIHGRTVAVVGPAESPLDHGEEIDGFDVVIRTKYTSTTAGTDAGVRYAGSRTDLSYYALTSIGLLRAGIYEALEDGRLELAVFRTAAYEPSAGRRTHAQIRFIPSEFKGLLRASQFAIQRIVYDVLRYGPKAIKVFNINFFLSPTAYRPGYLLDEHVFESQGLVQPLAAFGHDFLSDFVFTQEMARHRLIETDADVAQLLTLSPEQYLRALDRTEG